MNLNEIMKDVIMKNRSEIMETVCNYLSENEACPLYEGVPCDECMKYSFEVLVNSIKGDKK